jgi:hypothetical protein
MPFRTGRGESNSGFTDRGRKRGREKDAENKMEAERERRDNGKIGIEKESEKHGDKKRE